MSPIPRFRRGVKFRHDAARGQYVILAPERTFLPDEIAVEVLKRIDGVTDQDALVDDLVAAFGAPRDVIAADVETLIADLSAKGVLET